MDYIFSDKLAKILRKPSERTQLESVMIGISLIILGSIGIAIYFVFFTEMSLLFKICMSLSCLGIFLFQSSTLVTTYIQYYTLKITLGLYPEDAKLNIKIMEAKELIEELNKLVNKNGIK